MRAAVCLTLAVGSVLTIGSMFVAAEAQARSVGSITEFPAGQLANKPSAPTYVAAGSDGNIWYTDQGTTPAIGRITPSGQITEFTAGLEANNASSPRRIAAGPDGNIWFTDQGTTPATGTVIVPPPPGSGTKKGRRPQLHAKLKMRWTWTARSSKLDRVWLTSGLPRGATIALACHGRGCPRMLRVSRPQAAPRALTEMVGLSFRAGDRLTLTISAPGYIPQRDRLQIRSGAKPLVRPLRGVRRS